MMTEEELYRKFDIISFIMALLVVSIHLAVDYFYQLEADGMAFFITSFIRDNIATIAVPYFFMKSGCLLFRNFELKQYKGKMKRRIKSLVIPYLCWNTICYLFDMLILTVPITADLVAMRSLEPITVSNILKAVFGYSHNYFFWFMARLIIYSVISPIIYFMIKVKWLGIIVVVFCYAGGAVPLSLPYIDKNLGLFLIGGMIGYYAWPQMQRLYSFRSRIGALFLFLAGLIGIQYGNTMANNELLKSICHILCVISLWILTGNIGKKQMPLWIKASFVIYASQTLVASSIEKIIFLLLPHSELMSVINLFATMLLTGIIGSLLFVWLNNHTNLLCLCLTGHRGQKRNRRRSGSDKEQLQKDGGKNVQI